MAPGLDLRRAPQPRMAPTATPAAAPTTSRRLSAGPPGRAEPYSPPSVQFASRLSTAPRLETAVTEVAEAVLDDLGGTDPDLAIAFVTPHYREGWVRLASLFAE